MQTVTPLGSDALCRCPFNRSSRRCTIAKNPTPHEFHSDPWSAEVLSTLRAINVGNHPLDRANMVRAVGSLIGAACGDALGAPFEFGRAGRFSERFPASQLGGLGEMIGGGSFGWEPGEFTDDTQMALVLAESLLSCGGFDPEHVFTEWQRWAETATDVGLTTRVALDGDDWRTAAESAHLASGRTAANGALMRVFPVIVLAAGLGPDVGQWVGVMLARAQAALTHFDPAAGWGAAIAVETGRRLVLGEDFESALSSAIAILPDGQREVFEDLLAPSWQPRHHEAPSNGSVWGCLAQAVWGVRHHSDTESVLRAVIDLGGDTDTVACVAGALAGARDGIVGIPSRWTTYVHGSTSIDGTLMQYDNAGLQRIVRRLVGKHDPAPAASETHAGPTEVAPGIFAASLPGATNHVASGNDDVAVLSLCRTDGAFAGIAVRREVYLIDKSGDHNPRLDLVVTDAVDTIDAWLVEGRQVIVHCHGGRSRTGLVLLAWAMRRNGWTLSEAQTWLRGTWPRYDDWNGAFEAFLSSEWPELAQG